MDADLVAPKPTKEFHEAYAEIYGKAKKSQKKVETKPLSADEKNMLEELDIPPIKAPEKKEDKISKEKTKKQNKPGFFSNLFKKKKAEPSLDDLGLPPPKKETITETEDYKEFKDFSTIDLPSLKVPAKEYKALNTKPLKKAKPRKELKLPKLDTKPLFSDEELQEAAKHLEAALAEPQKTKKEFTKKIEKTTEPQTEKGRVHDFLAEIKFGAKKKESKDLTEMDIPPPKKKSSFLNVFKKKEDLFLPPVESLPKEILPLETPPEIKDERIGVLQFEKEKMKEGARDVQLAYEKKHQKETAGFDFLEDIKAPQKPAELEELQLEEVPSVRKADILTKQDIKIHARNFKEFEKKLKKTHSLTKREVNKQISKLKQHEKETHEKLKQHLEKHKEHITKKSKEIEKWNNKLDKQEQRIDKKIKKMESMEKALEIKQEEVRNYEPKLAELHKQQEILIQEEREHKQKMEEAESIEVRLKAEEDAIIRRIKQLEADQRLLNKEETTIVKATEKLEQQQKKISDKTRECKSLMKKVQDAEKSVKHKAGVLDEREAIIKRKERIIKEEVIRIEKLKKTALKLKNVEETYQRMKKRLRDAYQEHSYTYLQKTSARREPSIKPIAIEPTFQIKQKERVKEAMSGDISNLMTTTKQLILEKHYDDANNALNSLMKKYIHIPDNNPRKKEIYYEILSLKNMLKLELLE